jgi:hypothetical protein
MARAYAAKPSKLPLPDAGGRTSSVKTWLLLHTDAKLDIYIFYIYILAYSYILLFFHSVYYNYCR